MPATATDVEQVLAEAARLRIERDEARHDLHDVLDHRFIIEQAKGIIADKRGLTIDAAYDALRAYARDNNQTIGDVCALVVNATNAAGRRRGST